MPIARFQMDDGRIARFEVPDGTTPEQAHALMQQHFAPEQAVKPQGDKLQLATQPSGMDNFLGGLKKAGSDTLLGVKQLGAMAGMGDSKALAQEAANNKIRDAELMNSGAGMAGNVVGNIGMSLLPGGALKLASKAAPALSSVANALLAPKSLKGAATLGAGLGVIQPAADNEERVTNAAIGGLGGAGGNAAMQGVSRLLNPQTDKAVTALMNQGVTPTPGQVVGGLAARTEDKLMSVPLLGDAITAARKRSVADLNRAAYERALVGTGVDAKSLPVGHEGIAAVKEAVGKQYDDLLPKLVFKPDEQFSQEIGKIQQMSSGLGEKEQKRFISEINNIMSKSKNGVMLGETYKTVESKLAADAKSFLGSSDAYQKEMGAAMTSVLQSMKSALERSNPGYGKQLAQANSNYANYVRLRAAGSAAGDQSGGFSPAQLAGAVKRMDKSTGDGNTATGQSLMQDLSNAGQKVLSSKYPDSGTAGRGLVAGALGGAAILNPAVLGIGAAALPYTPQAQKVIAALLTQRPDLARNLGHVFQKGAGMGAIPGAAIANSQE